jgi:DNA-binding transcriptional regulator GbsR (MarR family)
MVSISTIISILGLLAASGIVGYVWRIGVKSETHEVRIASLETILQEKHDTLEGVKTTQSGMDIRLTKVEDAITAFRDVVPEIKSIGKLAEKLETVIDLDRQRIQNLEDRLLFKQLDNQQKS